MEGFVNIVLRLCMPDYVDFAHHDSTKDAYVDLRVCDLSPCFIAAHSASGGCQLHHAI
jgi:hypothetical protein